MTVTFPVRSVSWSMGDAVESVLGPDLLCWGAQFFAKNAHDPSFVSWHQDATYWGLSSPDVVTAAHGGGGNTLPLRLSPIERRPVT